jgi:hypothetical protein
VLANFSAIALPSEPDCVGGDPHDVVTDLSYTIPQELGQSLIWWRGKNFIWSLYAESTPFSGYHDNYLDQ